MRAPSLLRPEPAQPNFRICPVCPYYCRSEEAHSYCPWCGISLRRACGCGAPFGDPTLRCCRACRAPLRPALRAAPAKRAPESPDADERLNS